MDASERAVEGAAAARVTAAEVRRLVLVARSAWQTQRDLGLTDYDFDRWRRGALWDALPGHASFRALGQREYGAAMAAFLKLGGKAVRTAAGSRPAGAWGRGNERIAARESGPEGDRRRAEFALRRECAGLAGAFGSEAGAAAYARSLLRGIHRLEEGREFSGATAKQLWQTVFTLRSRARRKKAAGAGAAGNAPQKAQDARDGRGVSTYPPGPSRATRGFPPRGEAVSE